MYYNKNELICISIINGLLVTIMELSLYYFVCILCMCIGLPLYMIGYDPVVGGGSLLYKAQYAHVVHNDCELTTVHDSRNNVDSHTCSCIKTVMYTYNHKLNNTCSIYTYHDGYCDGNGRINTTYPILPVRKIFIGKLDGDCYSQQDVALLSSFGFAVLLIAGICVVIVVCCKTEGLIQSLLRPPEPKTTQYVELPPIPV
jgi:hypothetical protein